MRRLFLTLAVCMCDLLLSHALPLHHPMPLVCLATPSPIIQSGAPVRVGYETSSMVALTPDSNWVACLAIPARGRRQLPGRRDATARPGQFCSCTKLNLNDVQMCFKLHRWHRLPRSCYLLQARIRERVDVARRHTRLQVPESTCAASLLVDARNQSSSADSSELRPTDSGNPCTHQL